MEKKGVGKGVIGEEGKEGEEQEPGTGRGGQVSFPSCPIPYMSAHNPFANPRPSANP